MISFRLAGYPTSKKHSRYVFQYEAYDDLGGGINMFAIFFWRALAKRLIPLISEVQSKFATGDLGAKFNGKDSRSDGHMEVREVNSSVCVVVG
jgi:hypothetical protein